MKFKGPKKTLPNAKVWKPTAAEIHQAKKILTFGEAYGMKADKVKAILEKQLEQELLGTKIQDLNYPKLKEEIAKLADNVKGLGVQNITIDDELFYNNSKESLAEALEKKHIEALENHFAKQIQQAEDSKLLMNILVPEAPEKIQKLNLKGVSPSFEELEKIYGKAINLPSSFKEAEEKLLASLKVPKEFMGIDKAEGIDWSEQYILADPPPKTWSDNKLEMNDPPPFSPEALKKAMKGEVLPHVCTEIYSDPSYTYQTVPKWNEASFQTEKAKIVKWWRPDSRVQIAIRRYLERTLPASIPEHAKPRAVDLDSPINLEHYFEDLHGYLLLIPVPPTTSDVFEITLSGLTEQEAKEVLSKYAKSKSGKPVFHATKQLKEIGTHSKAIIAWSFESSSMAVNGEPLLYKTQLNEDGTLSCNCMGWTRGSAKSSEGRFCKHTRAIEDQFEVATLYKKWKKGEPLGDDFVPSGSAPVTSNGKPSAAPQFTAKRIVEI